MKTLTIVSGKGGVGKSSIAASLAVMISKQKRIVAVDCDVDASNFPLLFGVSQLDKKERVSTNYKAFVNNKAKNCKNIVDICAFSAISWNEKNELPEINHFLCEGCGACKLLCKEGITLKKVKNAVVGQSETKYGFPIVSGQLEMGESGSGNVVEFVKSRARKLAEKTGAELIIVDSSAGIGCPVIASVRESDFVIGVTEPTPSGLSDLKRVFEVVDHFGIPHGIIINKHDINPDFTRKIEQFAKESSIPILGKLPYDKDFVRAVVSLKPVVEINPKYHKTFQDLSKTVLNK